MPAFARGLGLAALHWPSLSAFAPSRAVAGLATALAARDARWREREAMRRLDDRILRDIGVARGDLEASLRAPALGRVRDRADQLQD